MPKTLEVPERNLASPDGQATVMVALAEQYLPDPQGSLSVTSSFKAPEYFDQPDAKVRVTVTRPDWTVALKAGCGRQVVGILQSIEDHEVALTVGSSPGMLPRYQSSTLQASATTVHELPDTEMCGYTRKFAVINLVTPNASVTETVNCQRLGEPANVPVTESPDCAVPLGTLPCVNAYR